MKNFDGKLRKASSVVLAGAMAVSLTACEPMPGGVNSLNFSSAARNIEFNDNCAKYRKPFQDIRAQRDKIIGQNVAAGAAIGLVGALLLGADAEQAIAAAAIGGLAGVANAYAQNAQSRGATQQSLAKFANSDARNEANQNDKLVRTVVNMNACRIDQADSVVAQAERGQMSPSQAKVVLERIKIETRNDNRAIQRVAGFNRSYNAYVGVLDAKDVAAARATRTAVKNYEPSVARIQRTSRGRAAIAPQRPPSAPTNVARAENSRQLIGATANEHQKSIDAEVALRQARLDKLLEREAI